MTVEQIIKKKFDCMYCNYYITKGDHLKRIQKCLTLMAFYFISLRSKKTA